MTETPGLNGWRAMGWPVATGLMAALLILQTLHYRELAGRPTTNTEAASIDAPTSYAAAVRRATPAVVNIYTRKVVRRPYNPLFDEPFFQRLFNRGTAPQRERIQRSLGSGRDHVRRRLPAHQQPRHRRRRARSWCCSRTGAMRSRQ